MKRNARYNDGRIFIKVFHEKIFPSGIAPVVSPLVFSPNTGIPL